MPYVRCPACEQVGYATAGYAHLACCVRCGAGLPPRRQVVLTPLSRIGRSGQGALRQNPQDHVDGDTAEAPDAV
jgi:hypothetical protein